MKKVLYAVGLILFLFASIAWSETMLGISGEFPSAKTFFVRALTNNLELYALMGLDVQDYEELKTTTFSLGFGGDFSPLSYEKLQPYMGCKTLLTLQHISIESTSKNKTYFSIVPILGARYQILKHLTFSYELQWDLTFGSFSTGTKGNSYITFWF